MNKSKISAISVGSLFILATITFMIGSGLINSLSFQNFSYKAAILGGLLEITCGISVAIIGLIIYKIEIVKSKKLSLFYFIFRVLEALVIIFGISFLLVSKSFIWKYETIIFLFSAIGGVLFSLILLLDKLVPKFFSILGIVGYLALLAGVILSLTGTVSLNSTYGMIFYIPGGIFELILPLWLIFKGFAK